MSYCAHCGSQSWSPTPCNCPGAIGEAQQQAVLYDKYSKAKIGLQNKPKEYALAEAKEQERLAARELTSQFAGFPYDLRFVSRWLSSYNVARAKVDELEKIG